MTEDRRILPRDSTFRRYRVHRFVWIFVGFHGEGSQTTVGCIKTTFLVISVAIFSEPLDLWPALLHRDMKTLIGFQWR